MTNEELVAAIKRGEAQPVELWNQMRRSFRSIALRYVKGEKDPLFEDLMQESYIAMLSAIDMYRDDGRAMFTTYSAYWMKARFHRYLENCDQAIRLPSGVYNRVRRYRRMVSTFKRDFDRSPTNAEITEALGAPAEQIRYEDYLLTVGSLDVPVGEDTETNVGDTVPDDSVDVEARAVENVNAAELSEKLWSLVDTLPGRQAQIVRMRYQENKLLRECGDVFGVSVERIRSDEAAALRKLRSRKIAKQLEPYLDDMRYSFGVRNGRDPTANAVIKMSEYLEMLKHDGLI